MQSEALEEHIPHDVRETIQNRLDSIEDTEDVRVVFACESGSRAWGFASVDSDYDVRFIYVRKPDWYLAIDQRRDVIELPIEGDLDINGWDLKKALHLLRKSNPPLLEWLGSPLVYRETTPVATWMRELLSECYSPRACVYHYLHMARGNFREFLKGPEVKRKKYLYVLRPIVAILWIERGLGVPPTLFQTALDATVEDPKTRVAINSLLEEKRSGRELDVGPQIPEISNFLETELARLEESPAANQTEPADWEPLNALFREALQQVWSQNA